MSSTDTDSTGASHTPPNLSVSEKLSLVTKLLIFIPPVLLGITYDIVKSFSFTPKTVRAVLIKRAARLSNVLSLRQLRSLTWPTGVTISSFCKTAGLVHETVLVNDNDNDHNVGGFPAARLHFISGPEGTNIKGKRNRNILLYFHGGGYMHPLMSSQLEFAYAAAKKAVADLAILEYTLAPELKYPGQLAQAVSALRYLLQRYDPSDIIIGGDSAGANLTLSVLAHIQEPHPLIKPSFNKYEHRHEHVHEGKQQMTLRGAFCISPRCANGSSAPSFTYNASKDIVSSQAMATIVANWEPVKEEVWATPLAGDSKFWQNIKTERLLLAAGLDEVYVDDITKFAGVIGAREDDEPTTRLQLALCPGEIHTQAVLDVGSGTSDGFMLNRVFAWLQAV